MQRLRSCLALELCHTATASAATASSGLLMQQMPAKLICMCFEE